MAYAGHQTQIVTVRYILTGQICENVLEYGTAETADYSDPVDFGTAWETANLSNFLDCLSNQVTLLDITFAPTHPVGVPAYAPYISVWNSAGSVDDDSLPPHVSYRLYKIPDNANIEGVLDGPFRAGMTRISGVPESFQENGLLNSLGVGALNALAAGMVEITAPSAISGDVVFNLLMVRRVTGSTDFGLTKVFNYVASAVLGSQNTRKI